MNQYLTDRDKKLLEIVVNKIIDKQEILRKLKYIIDDNKKIREIELKDAGLSIAGDIISNMIWYENEDYFRGEK